jgi:hypothetical protein
MQIHISDYPQLKQIAWDRHEDDFIDGDEALALYERNWRYVDQLHITDKEQQLIKLLTKQFGNGIFHV